MERRIPLFEAFLTPEEVLLIDFLNRLRELTAAPPKEIDFPVGDEVLGGEDITPEDDCHSE